VLAPLLLLLLHACTLFAHHLNRSTDMGFSIVIW
jgi:hypothetical protein